MVKSKIWSLARYCYQVIAAEAICNQGDMAAHEILLKRGFSYQLDILTYKMLARSGFVWPVISPI